MWRFITFILIAVLLSLLTTCEDSGKGENNFILERVVIAGSEWYGHAPVWAGIERGIYSQYGFDVKWQYLPSSTDRLESITRGGVQFASLGEIAMLKAMIRGEKSFYWIGSQDNAPGLEGLVAHVDIKTVSDLKGKRIGLPLDSSVEITARLLLEDAGLDLYKDEDVTLINLKSEEVPALFRAGYVDAALIWEPGFTQLKQIGGSEALLKTDKDTEIYSRFGTMTGPDVLVMSKKWVDKDPKRAKRFLEAYFAALLWVRDNPEKTAELAHGTYIRQELGQITDNTKHNVLGVICHFSRHNRWTFTGYTSVLIELLILTSGNIFKIW